MGTKTPRWWKTPGSTLSFQLARSFLPLGLIARRGHGAATKLNMSNGIIHLKSLATVPRKYREPHDRPIVVVYRKWTLPFLACIVCLSWKGLLRVYYSELSLYNPSSCFDSTFLPFLFLQRRLWDILVPLSYSRAQWRSGKYLLWPLKASKTQK